MNRKQSSRMALSHELNKLQFTELSLYNQLLVFGRVFPETVKLNSTRNNIATEYKKETFMPQRIEFSHTPNNTSISIKRSFYLLEDIDRQDLFKWKNEFLKTAQLANWNEETALEVLKSSIDTQYFDIVAGGIYARISYKQHYVC
ncbi:hypothetical protein DMUE_5039 [Dictyocoela muelleri]|nr:hypothetical protein DMUE_5039 [Dictyocoela muelleri]